MRIPTTRRQFVAGAAALAGAPLLAGCKEDPTADTAAGTPTPERPPEPAPWEAPGTLDEAAFAWGVQSGDATSDGAVLSVHTLETAVELVLVVAEGDDWVEVARQTLPTVDNVAQVELTDLSADTAYRYTFYAADGTRRSRVGRFRTAVAEGIRKIVFGATSCLGSVNPTWKNLSHAAEQDLDFFCLLGDTVYADGSETLEEYRDHWRAALSNESFRELSASTSLVAVWDDHEVDNNWYATDVDGTVDPPQLTFATSAFREALPQRIGGGAVGMWRTLRWGDGLELIVLDCRGERDGDRIMSEEQLAWAVDAVTSSTATLKLVLSSVHLADHSDLFGAIEAVDRWQGYPVQRQALLDALLQTAGVLVITGDMHYGAVQRLGAAGLPEHALFEVAAGPSGSRVNVLVAYADLPEQYPVLVPTWSFCRFEADPGAGQIVAQFVGDDGELLVEHVFQLG